MSPKHRLGKKHNKAQPILQTQCVRSSTSEDHLVQSLLHNLTDGDTESSLDLPSITSTTEAFTTTANERQYIQISKQILQYELKRKQSNPTLMSEQAHLEDEEISLPTSITSDWRLVLQDSITTDALQQGCISLLDQINSDLPLTQAEMDHATHFLEYASIHDKYRGYPDDKLLITLLSEDKPGQAKVTDALIKMGCYPSDTLQMAALSFLDVGISRSYFLSSVKVALTSLLGQLFQKLQPHEIPVNRATLKFHSHLVSIIDSFFCSISSKNRDYLYEHSALTSEIIEPVFQSSSTYLRSLIAAPVFPADPHFGFALLSNMKHINQIVTNKQYYCRFHNIPNFFGDLRNDFKEKLVPILGLTSKNEVKLGLRSDIVDPQPPLTWKKGFEYLLARVSEGRRFFDMEMLAVLYFMSHRLLHLQLVFCSDNKFGLKNRGSVISLSKLDSAALWALFTPTQPHHAPTVLAAFRKFMSYMDSVECSKQIWSGWFPSFVNAVDPSKLPFTSEFTPLHTNLIELLEDHLAKIEKSQFANYHVLTERRRRELDEIYRTFYQQTKEYIVHLSLHPFELANEYGHNIFLRFLSQSYLHDHANNLTKPYQDQVREEMDASARSSSSPPFILTSELVCYLTDEEILNVVDRIVALLDRNSNLDDATILLISTFCELQLRFAYLPELFRNAGRTPEHFFHAFESLLSLPIGIFTEAPMQYLLSTRPHSLQPTSDEWDDVDLGRVGIVRQIINRNNLAVVFEKEKLNRDVIRFVSQILPQAHNSATRLCQSQLERLLAPAIDILVEFFLQAPNVRKQDIFHSNERDDQEKVFVDIAELCDQRVLSQCLSRIGFFSRFVTALFNHNFNTSVSFLQIIVAPEQCPLLGIDDENAIRRTVPYFQEEGWQDALEYIFIQGKDANSFDALRKVRWMMLCFGANVNWLFFSSAFSKLFSFRLSIPTSKFAKFILSSLQNWETCPAIDDCCSCFLSLCKDSETIHRLFSDDRQLIFDTFQKLKEKTPSSVVLNTLTKISLFPYLRNAYNSLIAIHAITNRDHDAFSLLQDPIFPESPPTSPFYGLSFLKSLSIKLQTVFAQFKTDIHMPLSDIPTFLSLTDEEYNFYVRALFFCSSAWDLLVFDLDQSSSTVCRFHCSEM
ncbi:hypothetical protein BLNAU_9992 [Blattamonas nauphoetae]|uniref:Uncharacterized protein n=1 Tax=Blattamonas nauphoetae TaxID=2049346 RepID=A0ABQ9XU95_9EUKA|nr:hypothetical protein BLNAU_9992 [Blattamonas nauphoetae]